MWKKGERRVHYERESFDHRYAVGEWIVDCRMRGMTYREIGERLGVSTSNVIGREWRHGRAREELFKATAMSGRYAIRALMALAK